MIIRDPSHPVDNAIRTTTIDPSEGLLESTVKIHGKFCGMFLSSIDLPIDRAKSYYRNKDLQRLVGNALRRGWLG